MGGGSLCKRGVAHSVEGALALWGVSERGGGTAVDFVIHRQGEVVAQVVKLNVNKNRKQSDRTCGNRN